MTPKTAALSTVPAIETRGTPAPQLEVDRLLECARGHFFRGETFCRAATLLAASVRQDRAERLAPIDHVLLDAAIRSATHAAEILKRCNGAADLLVHQQTAERLEPIVDEAEGVAGFIKAARTLLHAMPLRDHADAVLQAMALLDEATEAQNRAEAATVNALIVLRDVATEAA